MNIIYIRQGWLSKILHAHSPGDTLLSVQQIQSLQNNYALKEFRLVSPAGSVADLWLGDLDLGTYGICKAVYIKDPNNAEYQWEAVPCPDGSDITKKLCDAGMFFFKKEDETFCSDKKDETLITMSALWFLINRDILKKYKTVIKMGKRRHQIQEMGEKRAAKYQQKPIKITDGISYTWEYENPRTFNRHCEAWGVRGHYRHYKNGKVVFIKPYTKGSGRLKDSHYEL